MVRWFIESVFQYSLNILMLYRIVSDMMRLQFMSLGMEQLLNEALANHTRLSHPRPDPVRPRVRQLGRRSRCQGGDGRRSLNIHPRRRSPALFLAVTPAYLCSHTIEVLSQDPGGWDLVAAPDSSNLRGAG